MTKKITTKIRKFLLAGAHFFAQAVQTIEKKPLTLGSFFATFTAIIVVRMIEQQWLDGFPQYGIEGQFYEFVQTFLFFLFSIMLFMVFVHVVARVDIQRAANVLLVGFLVILLPPIIDTMRFDIFWSYYEFAGVRDLMYGFWTLYGESPHIGVTDGDRFEIFMSVIAMGLYTYMHTRSRLRGIVAALGSYIILFILASLPSWIAIGVYGWHQGFMSIGAAQVAQMFLAPNPVLVRVIDNINIVLHLHMGIVYALSISVLGVFVTRTFFEKHWQLIKQGAVRWQTLAALIFFCSGSITVFALGLQSVYIFTLSAFAVPAVAVLIVAIVLLMTGLNILHDNQDAYSFDVGVLLVVAGLFFVMIVNNFAGLYVLAIIALFVLGRVRPFALMTLCGPRFVLYVLQSVMLYFMGVTVFLSHVSGVIVSERVMTMVVLSAVGIFLLLERGVCMGLSSRQMRFYVAFFWFFLVLVMIPFLNIFTYKWIVFLCALALFYVVQRYKSYDV